METPKYPHSSFARNSTPLVSGGGEVNTPLTNGTLSKMVLEKVSIQPIKTSLSTALRQQWSAYWSILKQYIKGKIGKAELHLSLKKILISKELGMHHRLVSFDLD